MTDLKSSRFSIEFEEHVFKRSKKELTKQQELCEEAYRNGAYQVFRHLRNLIVRDKWLDHKGFPIKERFFDNNYLACCVAIRLLIKDTGIGNQKLQKLLKFLVDIGWIETNNSYTAKKQNVYILGKWYILKNAEGKEYYREVLYEWEVKEGKRMAPCLRQENDNSIPDLTQLSEANSLEELRRTYGDYMVDMMTSS